MWRHHLVPLPSLQLLKEIAFLNPTCTYFQVALVVRDPELFYSHLRWVKQPFPVSFLDSFGLLCDLFILFCSYTPLPTLPFHVWERIWNSFTSSLEIFSSQFQAAEYAQKLLYFLQRCPEESICRPRTQQVHGQCWREEKPKRPHCQIHICEQI